MRALKAELEGAINFRKSAVNSGLPDIMFVSVFLCLGIYFTTFPLQCCYISYLSELTDSKRAKMQFKCSKDAEGGIIQLKTMNDAE